MDQQHKVVVGLGNPGDAYERTRHNVGRMVVVRCAEAVGATAWHTDRTARAQVATGSHGVVALTFVLPDNYMNRSGGSVKPFTSGVTDSAHLIVVHDDIDLPLGTVRIAYGRGAGGHNGVSSIEQTLGSRSFVRVRVGVVPVSPDGVLKKPRGAEAVERFILQPLSNRHLDELAPSIDRAVAALTAVIDSGHDAAMCEWNA